MRRILQGAKAASCCLEFVSVAHACLAERAGALSLTVLLWEVSNPLVSRKTDVLVLSATKFEVADDEHERLDIREGESDAAWLIDDELRTDGFDRGRGRCLVRWITRSLIVSTAAEPMRTATMPRESGAAEKGWPAASDVRRHESD